MQQKLNEILLKRLIFLCSFWYCAIPFKISHLGVSNKPARLILFFICLQVILKCNVNDSSFLISQVYNMVLISVCTYYAVMTRKVRKHLANRNFKIYFPSISFYIWYSTIHILWLVLLYDCLRNIMQYSDFTGFVILWFQKEYFCGNPYWKYCNFVNLESLFLPFKYNPYFVIHNPSYYIQITIT